MKYHTISKGTLLYRCTPDTALCSRLCKDTGKTGQYFSTYMLQSLAMVIEYQKEMLLGVYELQKDIQVLEGKYSHYEFPPTRTIYNPYCSWICKTYEYPNVNHFDPDILCILDWKYTIKSFFGRKSIGLTLDHGEVFITDLDDLQQVRLLKRYKVPLEGLLETIQRGNYQPFSSEYKKHLEELCMS